jgi:hypothetical protein
MMSDELKNITAKVISMLVEYSGGHSLTNTKGDRLWQGKNAINVTEVVYKVLEWNTRYVDDTNVVKMQNRIAELEEALEIADYAFDLCRRYNGNSKSYYFNEAKQALNKGKK